MMYIPAVHFEAKQLRSIHFKAHQLRYCSMYRNQIENIYALKYFLKTLKVRSQSFVRLRNYEIISILFYSSYCATLENNTSLFPKTQIDQINDAIRPFEKKNKKNSVSYQQNRKLIITILNSIPPSGGLQCCYRKISPGTL